MSTTKPNKRKRTKPATAKPLSEQLREHLQSCGLTRYEISQRTGIDQAALSRFVNRRVGLSTITFDRLGECLGLRLVMDKPAEQATEGKAASKRRMIRARAGKLPA